VERNELRLYYQPKISLRSANISSVEALIRWEHPGRGLVPPCVFIPFAEHTGYIQLLTRWVMREAVRQCAEWLREDLRLAISVNISARDLMNRDLPDQIAALLAEHLRCMAEVSPPESRHALNLDGLRRPEITFWTVWQGKELAGCGALKELDAEHGEVKSMRTAAAYVRKGVASRLLEHLISEAKRRGYRRLSLETGAMDYFKPAHTLYQKFGFKRCAPFVGYREDPNSVFMTKEL